MRQCLYALKVQAHWYRAGRFIAALLILLSGFAAATQAQAQAKLTLGLTERGATSPATDYTVTEGEALTVTVRLSGRPADGAIPIEVQLSHFAARSGNTAHHIQDFDFSFTSTQLTFTHANCQTLDASGACNKMLVIPTRDDTIVEGDEEAQIRAFSSQTEQVTSNNASSVKIIDNDMPEPVTLSRLGSLFYLVDEGETLTITLQLSGPPAQPVEVSLSKRGKINAKDRHFVGGLPFGKVLVTFQPPGADSSLNPCPSTGVCERTIEIVTIDDDVYEGNRGFSFNLEIKEHDENVVTYDIATRRAQPNIVEDESAPPELSIAKTNYPIDEGDTLTVAVQLDTVPTEDVAVEFRQVGTPTTSAADFADGSPFDKTLATFTTANCSTAPCTQTITIATVDDDVFESTERFSFMLHTDVANSVAVVRANNPGHVTITDNDVATAPVAHAGVNRTAIVGATVTLDGRLSRNPARSRAAIGLHYAWTAPAGVDLNVAFLIPLRPTFVVPDLPVDTELEFTLVVTNDDLMRLKSEPDTVTITVKARPVDEPVFVEDVVDQFWAVGQVVSVTLPRMIADTDTATDGATYTYSLVPDLPAGLTFDAATRTIAGTTPGAATRKTYTYTAVVRRANTLVSFDDPNDPIDFSDPSICVSPDVVVNGVTRTCRGRPDDAGDSVAVHDQEFDIVVGGDNNPPTAAATTTTERVGGGVVVTLDGTGSSDPDGERLTYVWTSPANVTLSSDTDPQPTFTSAASLTPQTLTFSLVVTDQRGAASTNTATVVVTVAAAPNTAPTANAGPNQIVGGGETVTLNGSAIDPDPETVSLAWTPPDNVTLSGNAEPQPTFTAPDATTEDQVLTFTLVATDNRGKASEERAVAITVLAERLASDIESRTTGRIEEGQSASFALSLAEPFFPDGTPERLRTFTLDVLDDGTGGNALLADLVPAGLTVVFPAGRGIARFEVATLDDDIAEPLETLTLAINGSQAAVEIADNEPYLVSFDPASVQFAEGEEQVVNINLDRPFSGRNSNSTLPANAQFIGAGGTATADYLADYQAWDITFADGDISVPVTFTDGQQSVSVTLLAVADDRDEAAETTRLALGGNDLLRDNELPITIEASGTAPPSSPNAIPTANAGTDQEVPSGSQVTLVGSGSDSGGGTVEGYRWTRTGGTSSSSVTLSSKEAQMPTFTADTLAPGALAATHVFSLVVVDNDGAQSQPDEVTITVTSPNKRPTAVATGPTIPVASGSLVTLDGTSSRDDDGTVVGYSWTRHVGTGSTSLTLNNPLSAMPTFTADTLNPGDAMVAHVFRLVVTDDDGAESLWNEVTVWVTAETGAAQSPTANAGTDQEVSSGSLVTLDGSGSTASDGTSEPDGYSWTRTGGTGSRSVRLDDPTLQQPIFTADTLAPGVTEVTHVFRLVVTDNGVDSLGSLVTITVTSDPNTDLTVPEGEEITAARTETLKRGAAILGSEIGSSLAGAVSARGGQATPQNTLRLGAAAGNEQSGISDFDPNQEYASVKDALHGLQASQLLGSNEDGSKFAGIWFKGDANRFKDRSDQGERDGDITSLHAGLDVRLTPQLLVGLGGSLHEGDFDYRGQGGMTGKAGFEIASLYPYVTWTQDDTTAWAAFGFGSGELKVTEGNLERTSDLDQTLAAFGVARHFAPSERIDTVLRLEGLYSNLGTASSKSDQQALEYDGFDTEVWRMRGQGEIGWTLYEREGLHLRPFVGLGLRVEEGKELGTDQEIGLDLNTGGLHLRAEGRYHKLEEGSRVYGYSLTADYDSEDDSRGLLFALRAQQGSQRSLDQFDADQISQAASGRQTEAEVGYGFLLERGGLLKPYLVRRFASERDSSEFGLDYKLRALRMGLGYEQIRADADQPEEDRFSIKAKLQF